MNIGIVLAVAPGYSETFFRSKIQGLITEGHEVVLFCSGNPQNFNLCPVKLLPKVYKNQVGQFLNAINVFAGLVPYFKKVSNFIRLERREGRSWMVTLKHLYTYAPVFKQKLDWIHFGYGTLTIGAEYVGAAIGAKMAVSFRGFDIGVYPVKHPGCYQKLWKSVDKIHVISDDIAQLVYKNGFKDQAPLVKITPAIDTQYFSASTPKTFEEPIQFITVARLHYIKGLDYSLEALALLKKNGVKFNYTIIGTGPEEEALKFACYQLSLQKEVRFLGKMDYALVKTHLQSAHIYLQYSVQEGFCNAVLEAQAMGLLCVVSDAGGLSENVKHAVTGFVAKKRNPLELACTIEKLIKLPNIEKQQMQKAAKARVRENYGIIEQQKEFVKFYST